jgi:hypothetical protein
MSSSNAVSDSENVKRVFVPSLEKATKAINKLIDGFVEEHDLTKLLEERKVSFSDDLFQKKLEKFLKKFFVKDDDKEESGKKKRKGKNGKEKKLKDSNAPKKTKTSYIFFCQDKRQEVKVANPEIKETDVTVELGKMWKSISPLSKKKYEEMSTKDKTRYETEMKYYVKPSLEEITKSVESSKKKKGISGYIYFCKEKRGQVKESNTELSTKEITRELGRIWTQLDKDSKEEYNSKARQFNDETKVVEEREEVEEKSKNTKNMDNDDVKDEKKMNSKKDDDIEEKKDVKEKKEKKTRNSKKKEDNTKEEKDLKEKKEKKTMNFKKDGDIEKEEEDEEEKKIRNSKKKKDDAENEKEEKKGKKEDVKQKKTMNSKKEETQEKKNSEEKKKDSKKNDKKVKKDKKKEGIDKHGDDNTEIIDVD